MMIRIIIPIISIILTTIVFIGCEFALENPCVYTIASPDKTERTYCYDDMPVTLDECREKGQQKAESLGQGHQLIRYGSTSEQTCADDQQ